MQECENIDREIQQILAGDKEAFRGIVEAYEARVRIILAAMLPDSSAVRDVAQEVFVTAYLKLSEYELGTNFDAWIATITRNYAMNHRRKIFRAWAAKEKYRAEIEETLAPRLDGMAAGVDPNLSQILAECLAKLEENIRGMLEAFYFESQSGRDVAQRFGRTEGSIRVTLSRARTAVAKCLRSKGAFQNV